MDTREVIPLCGLTHWNQDVVLYSMFPRLIKDREP
jgi:hypothetical protein